jgi:pullulanase
MVFTAQGTPFFLGGEEFARTKPVEGSDEVAENSYNLPLFTNVLRYDWNEQQEALQEYYKGLIAFRKAHKGLRMTTAEQVRENIRFVDGLPEKVVAFTIQQEKETLFIVYNANPKSVEIALPEDGTWNLFIDGEQAGTKVLGTATQTAEVSAVSCAVYVASGIRSLSY